MLNPHTPPFIFLSLRSHFYYYQPLHPPPMQTCYQPFCYFYFHHNNNEQVIQQEPHRPPPCWSTSSSNMLLSQLVTEASHQLRGSMRATVSSSMEFDESKLDVEIRTTILIKYILNKLSRDILMALLDQHCAEENYQATLEASPLSA